MQYIYLILINNSHLYGLNVSHTQISSQGIKYLTAVLKKNCTLKVLDLTGTGINQADKNNFMETLSQVRIVSRPIITEKADQNMTNNLNKEVNSSLIGDLLDCFEQRALAKP